MGIDLEALKSSIEANRLPEAREAFRELFGCRGTEFEALAGRLTRPRFLELCTTLWQIRRAPLHLRPTLALALPLALASDGLSPDDQAEALAILKAIIQGVPATADRAGPRGTS